MSTAAHGFHVVSALVLALSGILSLSPVARADGERGTVPEPAGFDSNHPVMDSLSRAGVVGGIPEITHVKAEVWPGGNIQSAMNNGGPGVVLLRNGTHQLWDPLYMRKGVILRGEDRNSTILSVKYRSTWKKFAIQFNASDKCEYAGLENLSLAYDAVSLNPIDGSYSNNPHGITDLYAGFVAFRGKNNWVDSCNLRKSGSDPVLMGGWHNTIRNCYIDRCYNKGAGGNGYFDLRGDRNLVHNNWIRRIRHFAIQQGAWKNVVNGNQIDVDVNFHSGDDGHNLVEYNEINRSASHPWTVFATGGSAYGHAPPGPYNIIYNNTTWDGTNGTSPFSNRDVTYTFWNYGTPSVTNWAKPKWSKYYSIKYLPWPWCAGDIGSGEQTGFASQSSGTWTVKADGADVWGRQDDCYYVWQPLHGDGEIVAQVKNQPWAHAWAKAGLMIREDIYEGSRHAMVCVTPGNGTSFQYRTWTDGESSSITPGDGQTAPAWLKLERRGNTLTGSVLRNNTWVQIGSATISMWSQAHIGFFVSSHIASSQTEVQFDQPVVTRVPADLVWSGSAGNEWDNGTTANFNGGTKAFFAHDNVTFDDTAVNPDVTLDAQVFPSLVTFAHGNPVSLFTVTGDGGITGSGSLVKSGAGTTILAVDNSYGGTTTVTGGKLQLGNGGAGGSLGTGAIEVAAGTTLAFNRSGNPIIANPISGGGKVAVTAGGPILSGPNTYSGGITVSNEAHARLPAGTGLGAVPDTPVADAIVLQNGGLKNQDSDPVIHANRGITLAGDGYFTAGWTKTLTIDGPITGGGNVFINWDSGRVLFTSPASDWTGSLTLGGDKSGSYGSTGARLQIAQLNHAGQPGPLGAATANPANLVFRGGSLIYTGPSAGSDRGTTLETGGTIEVTETTTDALFSGVFTGPGTLTKGGAGRLVLSAENDFTGNVVVVDGVLAITHGNALGAPAKTVQVAGNAAGSQTPELRLSGDITATANIWTLSGNGIAATGAVRNFDGNNTLIATDRINAAAGNGSLTLYSDAGTFTLNAPLLTANAADRQLLLAGPGNGVLNASIQNGATANLPVIKNGTGTWSLIGAHTYTGATTVSAGTLLVNAPGTLDASSAVSVAAGATLGGNGQILSPITVAGTLAPGASAGTLTTNDVTFEPGSSYAFEIADWNGATPGADWDLLAADTLVFNNTPASKLTLVISDPDANFSEANRTFPIATAVTSIAGFDPAAVAIDATAFTGSGTWAVQQNALAIELVYTAGTSNTFAAWAAANAPGQTLDMDHDHDGVANGIEFFMGESGSSFTAMPVPDASRTISWTKDPDYPGTYGSDYVVETSIDLADWDPVPVGQVTIGASVDYTIPNNVPARFARLKVTGP